MIKTSASSETAVSSTNNNTEPLVIQDLRHHLKGRSEENEEGDDSHIEEKEGGGDYGDEVESGRSAVALPVAAIKCLIDVIKRTQSNTMMGLQMELKSASEKMVEFAMNGDLKNGVLLGGRSHIALSSGCELFMKYITRCFLELPDFQSCISQIIERGQRFSNISLAARDRIATVGQPFIHPGSTVLTHGWSRVVASLLVKAAEHTHFEIIVLEGRPDASGAKAAAKIYAKAGIPTTIVLDSAMAYVMERVDIVVVGAEGVVENGGIVNKIGTYGMAIAAKELGKPFYVAAESFKFARLFPLNQSDLPEMGRSMKDRLNFVDTACWAATGGAVGIKPKPVLENEQKTTDPNDEKVSSSIRGLVTLPDEVQVENPPCDYTPAKFITLLFTDLGVLTPSAVSDELIRLYQ